MKILVDMDQVLVDFYNHPFDDLNIRKNKGEFFTLAGPVEMYDEQFFKELLPLPGAIEGVKELIDYGHDVYICTKPIAICEHSYSGKMLWVKRYLPELLTKMIMIQDKGMISADLLIDDDPKQTLSFSKKQKSKTWLFYPDDSVKEWGLITSIYASKE